MAGNRDQDDDRTDVVAEQRAYTRRFPFMVVGALALLIGAGFIVEWLVR